MVWRSGKRSTFRAGAHGSGRRCDECGPHLEIRGRPVKDPRRLFRVHGADPSGGTRMQLQELVHHLTDLIWQAEQRTEHAMDDAILTYVRDAVNAEIEYRRRMRELDRRMAELETPKEIAAPV